MSQKIVMALIVIGCVVTYIGYKEYSVGKNSSYPPAQFDLTQYETTPKRPTNNYIVLNEHFKIYTPLIYTYKSSQADGNPSTRVAYYIYPVVSENHPYALKIENLSKKYGGLKNIPVQDIPTLDYPSVLLKIDKAIKVSNLPEGITYSDRSEGLITNTLSNLPYEESVFIEGYFSKIDPSKTLIIEENRKPLRKRTIYGIIALGVGLIAFCYIALSFDFVEPSYGRRVT